MGRRWCAAVAVALALVATTTACSSDAADRAAAPTTTAAAPTSTTTTVPVAEELAPDATDFYTVPDPLPQGLHGTLIRYQEVTPTVLEGATTYRIMYTSWNIGSETIAVTGTALVPEAAAPAGGRPVLTIAHGTTGIADECAPSKAPGGELRLLADPIARGWLVAETDYEGLGTPGRHPYLVGVSEGHSTLDAAIAAGQLPGADPSDRVAIAGYSQGGHGALWANQLAADYAPDLEVVGTFAGAPATEMQIILRGAPGGFKALMVAGYAAAYPDQLDPATFFTPAAVAALDSVDEGCTGEVFEAMSAVPADQITLPTAFDGPWTAVADSNDPGAVATDDPILIIHSQQDETVPIILSSFLLDRMCEAGQVVERRVLPDGGGHGPAAIVAYPEALTWLADRFEAEPAEPVDSCPS